MEKMKVHELAKELGIQSKDVISFLAEKGIEVKAAMSSVEDDAIAMVRDKFGKAAKPAKAENAPEKEAAPAKQEAKVNETAKPQPKAEASSSAEPVKKKKIIFVNNPHNSKLPGQGGPRQGQQSAPQGQRPQGGKPAPQKGHTISGNEYTHQIIKPRQDVINKQLSEQRAKDEARRQEEAAAEARAQAQAQAQAQAEAKAKAQAQAQAQEKEKHVEQARPNRPMNVVIEEAPKK